MVNLVGIDTPCEKKKSKIFLSKSPIFWHIFENRAKKGPCRAETKKDTKSFVKHKMSATMN